MSPDFLTIVVMTWLALLTVGVVGIAVASIPPAWRKWRSARRQHAEWKRVYLQRTTNTPVFFPHDFGPDSNYDEET